MEALPQFPAPEVVWTDVARLCRRVCVLRETGRQDEAERLRQGALASLVAAVRTSTDTDAAVAARLEAVFAQETERVANAAVLAELLQPFLTEQLRPLATPLGTTSNVRPAVPNPPRVAPPRTAAASIADFIDAMIEQETPPHGSGPGRR